MTLSHTGTTCSLHVHPACPLYASFSIPLPAIAHSTLPPFVFLHSILITFFQWPSLPNSQCIFVYSVNTHPLSLCEPLLRRQAWVERPLGSGSRYCRTERWSILDHCSSTEQWGGGGGGGGQNQSILLRMQDLALLFTV